MTLLQTIKTEKCCVNGRAIFEPGIVNRRAQRAITPPAARCPDSSALLGKGTAAFMSMVGIRPVVGEIV